MTKPETDQGDVDKYRETVRRLVMASGDEQPHLTGPD